MLSKINIMRKEIYKPAIAQDKDRDVPEFGGFAPHELRQPEIRGISPDLFGGEALRVLRRNALRRVLYFGYGVGEIPPVHFPNAEHFQHIPFTNNHWLRYGNMESEYSRVKFMLETYPSRQFPEVFDGICRNVLGSGNFLQEWSNQIPRLDKASAAAYERAARQMEELKVHDDLGYNNGEQGAYQSEPVFYQVSEEGGGLERRLWEGALAQITEELQQHNFRNLPSFLHLYNRIKDPITPIRSVLPEQVRVFRELYGECLSLSLDDSHNLERQGVLVVQLALESSFLALPGARNVVCVVYGGHHELPYIYIDAARLPRGEFAGPRRVIEILGEILDDSKKCGQPVITPITVSYCQESFQAKPDLFIIDGNNRATAILLMKFLDYVNFDREEIFNHKDSLRRFISLYDLDIEWERDLAAALKVISPDLVEVVVGRKNIIQQFARAKIPALLVQEPNFHTVAVAQSHAERIVLLQPMHQVIYNQKRRSMAIPAKQQSHGRAAGNDIRMSLEV